MKVVTLCGSMRFEADMRRIAMELETKQGYCVICPITAPDITLNADDLDNLARAHFKKIDMSDVVYIVNIGGYIGESVLRELKYAQKHNKEIVLHEK